MLRQNDGRPPIAECGYPSKPPGLLLMSGSGVAGAIVDADGAGSVLPAFAA